MAREVFARAHDSVALLHEFLLVGARLTPERAAVVEYAGDTYGTISYRQLERRVTALAAQLDELGLDIGDRVILESDTSSWSIAAFLACSTLGLPFIPVSPETPTQRLKAIIDSVEPALHLQAEGGRREGLPEGLGLARFGPEGLSVERAPEARVRRRREIAATDPAYMIFTSGTTGRPKGVVMSHRAILSFYRGMIAQGIVAPEDRVATTSPLQFDFSLLDIGLALGSGAAIVPVPRDLLRWPRRFVKFLAGAEVTQVNGVPSIWRPVLKHESEALATQCKTIRGVLYSGEKFPLPELRKLQSSLQPGARIVNCFGSTESVASSFTDVPNPLPLDVEELSIGFAHPGAEMVLVGEDGAAVVEPGGVGQIYLRSGALFTSYWNDPEATERALVPDPLEPRSGQIVFRTGDLARLGDNGELYFCGRADSLVKIRGNRVELGEVERRVADFPGVAAATAVVVPVKDRDPALAVFVVMAAGQALDELELKAFCMEALPDYMVPSDVRVLDELPTTANGKVDRAALLAHVA